MPPADPSDWIQPRLRHIGDRIRARRLELGLTQEQLAALAGVDRSTIQRIEAGATDARISHLLRIARALHMSAVDLFT